MKVLFVYPTVPETYWSFRHALRFYGKRANLPPLGLLTVSALLPRSWERRLVDMNVQELVDGDIDWADIVFISAMVVQKQSLGEVVARCKAAGKRVVVGGPYVSTSANRMPAADHIFIGEAEATLPEFVRDLERGEAKRVYEAPERPSMALTLLPDFNLIDMSRYYTMPVQFSRGCPFQCEFCDIIEIYGRVPRTKSNAQVIAELDQLYRLGWRGVVFIVDDNFIGSKPKVKLLLPELTQWMVRHGHPFQFITEASVNLADDDELLEGMRKAGFRNVFLGIETPIEASLQETQKYQNTRHDLLASVRKIQEYGMEVMAGFIVGFDNDPDDVFERQITFIRESAIPLAMVGVLQALPGTQLWRRLEREGRLLADDVDLTDRALTFVPRMETARLVEGYNHVLRTIYKADEYYSRVLDSLDRVIQEKPERRRAGLTRDAAAFARLVFALGFRDKARGSYWRFLGKVVLRHRAKFVPAMRLAAQGYHLRRMAASSTVLGSTGREMRVAETPPLRADLELTEWPGRAGLPPV